MKKLLLPVMLIVILLIVGCRNNAYTDVEEYETLETNDEYNTDEPEPTLPPYEKQPEPYYPDEADEHENEAESLPERFGDASVKPQNAVAISAASTHALAIMEDGSLWAWGAGAPDWWTVGWFSLIGDGTPETRTLPVKIMEDVAFAVAGHSHSFAITTDGVLWAWGGNYFGQLGDGTTETRLSPVRIMEDVVYVTMPSHVPCSHVGVGGWRSYAIRGDRSLWAWGHNYMGAGAWHIALGDGTVENRHLPVQILENVAHVVPTRNGGLALTYDNVLWRWHGQGFRNIGGGESIEIPAQLYPAPLMENIASISPCAAFAITTGGELWRIGHEPDEPTWVMDDVRYAAGPFIITTDDTLWAHGRNRLPDHWRPGPLLGDGTTIDRDIPVKIMEDIAVVHTMGNVAYAITNSGTLWAWGTNDRTGIIGDGSILSWDDVEEHMWEFAWEYHGEHGFECGRRWLLDNNGGTGIRLSPVKILENVVSVAATYYLFDHGWIRGFRTFALTECGAVWAWGENDVFSQGWSLLGDGTSEIRLSTVRIIEGR